MEDASIMDARHEEKGQIQSDLPFFDGFPYLWIRVVPCLYHLSLLPASYSYSELLEFGRRQSLANKLRTCVVINSHCCVYFDSDGEEKLSESIPQGGLIITEKLKPYSALQESEELRRRKERLRAFQEKYKIDGTFFGDLAKGGRKATVDELLRLTGHQKDSRPNGLAQCISCREWKGECLDPNPIFQGWIMPVSCICENKNFCAGCGHLLHSRKLNANFYRIEDGQIIHIPAFPALSHRCG